MKHNFEVEGKGFEKNFDINLQLRGTRDLQVDLPPRTYTLARSFDDHQARGMQLELRAGQQQTTSSIKRAIFQP
jgi:hypothetical protein